MILFKQLLSFLFTVFLSSCALFDSRNNQIKDVDNVNLVERCIAQTSAESNIHLVPQENYGEEVLSLLRENGKDGVFILHFNFFTDNNGDSYPKQIATELENIKKKFPKTPLVVALESKKDKDDPTGKGVAQRNSKTKMRLQKAGIMVYDVHGQSREIQTPIGKEDGVSHTKLIIVGDEIIAGSNNFTKQSTDVGANNEMNISIKSNKIANGLREYVNKIIAKPGEMVDMEIEDGNARVLTDRLHFNELISQIKLAQSGDVIGLSMYQFLYRNENDIQAKQVYEELLAAHKRGASLELFLNRADDLKTQNSEANLRVAELFLQNNVQKVYFDPEGKISHSKFFYRISKTEKISMISSVNIYRGDFNDNHQLTFIIKDDAFTEHLFSYFKQQIAYDGTLVSQIPADPVTKLRYKIIDSDGKKTAWNASLPPKRMLRFWLGFKQDDILREEFESNINKNFISETVEVGGGRGLEAYLPSFFPEEKPEFIPDEVALILYASEEQYNAIRSTERGRRYGPSHFEKGYFAKINKQGFNSGSVLGEEYQGNVEITPEKRAYVLGDFDVNWQEGVALRRTLLPIQNLTPAIVQTYLNSLVTRFDKLGIKGAVAVVDPKYLMIMFNVRDQQLAQFVDVALDSIESNVFKKINHIILENQKQGLAYIRAGAGISVQFKSELKVRSELMAPVLGVSSKSEFKIMGGRCENIFN